MKASIGMLAVRVERGDGCIRYLEVTLTLFEESEVMNPRGWENKLHFNRNGHQFREEVVSLI